MHYEVVRFMRSRFPKVIANPGLGENQDTSDKRVDSSRKGYQRGVPDLIYPYVTARYNGIAIELKHPGGRGELAEAQAHQLAYYRDQKYLVIVSNSYDHIIEQILDFFKDGRLSCPHCKISIHNRYKTPLSRQKHIDGFHKSVIKPSYAADLLALCN